MLVLCSDGLTSGAILAELRPRVAGLETAAVVVTADDVYKEKNYHVPGTVAGLNDLGLSADIFDLDASPAGGLEKYDVVEFIGGNPYYLLDAVRRHGAEPVLRRIAEEKVLIGWSAAAFVFGPMLSLVDRYSPEMNRWGLTDLTGLGLTAVQVLPHYSRFITRFERFEQICAEYEQANGVSVTRLNDGDAVFIDAGAVTLVRAHR